MLFSNRIFSCHPDNTLVGIIFGAWSLATCPVMAQDFTTRIAERDPLLNVFPPLQNGLALGETLKGSIAKSFSINTVYDSNFFLEENGAQSEFTTNFSSPLSYFSDPEGGASFSFSANYAPVYRAYFENTELNGFDQSGDIALKIEGAKTEVSAFSRYSEVSATDRLTGQFINGSLFRTGIRASYQIAPRTTLYSELTASASDYGNVSIVGADVYTEEFGGYWATTEKFKIGPAIRYTTTKSDNIGTLDSWNLYLQAQYSAGQRIQIAGSLGLDYSTSSRPEEDSTVGLTGELVADFLISDRIAWSNSIRYLTVPSPTESSYIINDFGVTSTLTRQLLSATVEVGLDLNHSAYEAVGKVVDNLGPEENIGVFISYNRKLISDRVGLTSMVRYRLNSGESDWRQLQLTIGFSLAL